MLLDFFDAFDISPEVLIDRANEVRWLRERLQRDLARPERHRARAYAVIGEKGIGKTLLARHVLHTLRAEHSGQTLFLEADCRRCRNLRSTLSNLAQTAVQELSELQRATAPISGALIDNARILATIARYDRVELKHVHEDLRQYEAALSVAGGGALLALLETQLKVSLKRSRSDVATLSGEVSFDEELLIAAFCALLEDVSAAGFRSIVLLDNLDELRHEYWDGDVRREVRRDVDRILALGAAPASLVITMRAYFAAALPREHEPPLVLGSLPEGELLCLLQKRLERERPEVQNLLDHPDRAAALRQLARMAPTPLAFLVWFRFLFEDAAPALRADALHADLKAFAWRRYAMLPPTVLQAVVGAFASPGASCDRATLLTACGGNEAVFTQLADSQAVLPVDFWNPTAFTLDPELQFLHPHHAG